MRPRWRRGRADVAGSHPAEAALVATAWGLGPEPALAAHLSECPSCTRAVESFRETLAADHVTEEDAADAHFTPARLERQRAAILRHITPHPAARVLSFPTRGRVMPAARRVARRWVAAAAAAGLVVGLWAGRSLFDPHVPRLPWGPSSVGVTGRPLPTQSPSDEAFLVELEVAVGSPRFEPLRPLDAMLPPIHEAY